jgi:hypothetical protein
MSSGGLHAGKRSTESALGFSYMWNGGYVGGTFLGPWGLLELLRLPIVTVAWDLDSVARWDADGSDLIVFCGWSIARYVQTPDFVLDHVAQRQDRSARDGFKMQMGSRCRWCPAKRRFSAASTSRISQPWLELGYAQRNACSGPCSPCALPRKMRPGPGAEIYLHKSVT